RRPDKISAPPIRYSGLIPNAQPTITRRMMVPMPTPPARPMGKPPGPSPRRSSTLSLRGNSSKRMIYPLQIPPRSSPQFRQLRQRREPAIGGQLVDKPRKSLRQLSDEFFLREA